MTINEYLIRIREYLESERQVMAQRCIDRFGEEKIRKELSLEKLSSEEILTFLIEALRT